MKITDFPEIKPDGAEIRDGDAIITLSLDDEWKPGQSVSGRLAIYEAGEQNNQWRVKVSESGDIVPHADDFYIASELLGVMIRNQSQSDSASPSGDTALPEAE